MRTAVLVLLLASNSARCDPPEVPKELKAEPGQILEVAVKADDVGHRVTSDRVLFRELKSETAGERVFWFQAAAPGEYHVVWWTKGETKGVVTTIVVGPKPAPPGPGPAPKPDDPAPQPSAELRQKIADAYATDKGSRADATQLAALYKEAAKLCVKKTAGVYDCPSSKELLRRVREAGASLVGPDVLTAVRTVAATVLADQLGMPSDDALTDAQRRAAADAYLKLAACLESLQ
jgi:hypothetical protein